MYIYSDLLSLINFVINTYRWESRKIKNRQNKEHSNSTYNVCTTKYNEQTNIILREINNNLKPTENFSKSSFRQNNQSDPGARTCVSKKADCCVASAHPPLPFKQNNMSPQLRTQKCKRTLLCVYLKTAEMRFLDWIPYEKTAKGTSNRKIAKVRAVRISTSAL